MRFHIFFVAFLFWILNAKHSLGVSVPNAEYQEAEIIEILLEEYDDRFSISEIWQNIKHDLSSARESIVNASKEILEKIEMKIYELQLKADELLKTVKENLNELLEYSKKNLNEIASKSQEKAEYVMECYQSHEQEMENIVIGAVNQIRRCKTSISNKDSKLERVVSRTAVKEGVFLENVTSKLDACANDEENLDQCLTNLNDYISSQIASKDIVSEEENDAKIIIYDILNKILFCTSHEAIKASGKLSENVNDFEKCVNN